MSKSYMGHELNDEPLISRTGTDPNGPPPTERIPDEDPHLKGRPHHIEARLASLDPEMRELFEKTVADKVNYERRAKENSERLAKTEAKLNEIAQREQAAERKRLEEQGEFKELASKAEQRARELEEKLFHIQVRSNMERELSNHGALDAEIASEFILSKYGDELRSNPAAVSDVINRFKESKPLLFKQAELQPAPQPVQYAPIQRSSGLNTPTPPSGNAPSQFDARNKKVPLSEVERQWKEQTKNANFFNVNP